MIDFSSTFDTTNALSGMFLWLIFGYLSGLLNCDLQRFLQQHPFIIHAFGLTAFFFLFTLLDSNNKTHIYAIWFKTFFVYILFVLMTKSKWFFVIPVLVLLLIDQTIKKDIAFKKAMGQNIENREKQQLLTSKILNYVILLIILVGTVHYYFIQKAEHKQFSWMKFFLGMSRCKK